MDVFRSSLCLPPLCIRLIKITAEEHPRAGRYVELAGCGGGVDVDGAPSAGSADAFVSWNWDSDWEDVLEALVTRVSPTVSQECKVSLAAKRKSVTGQDFISIHGCVQPRAQLMACSTVVTITFSSNRPSIQDCG